MQLTPLESSQHLGLDRLVAERGLGEDSLGQVLLAVGVGTNELLKSILPGDRLLEDVLLFDAKEANVDKSLDELGETVVTDGTSDDGLGIGDAVSRKFSNGCRSYICM